jgi:hypothetical protein
MSRLTRSMQMAMSQKYDHVCQVCNRRFKHWHPRTHECVACRDKRLKAAESRLREFDLTQKPDAWL